VIGKEGFVDTELAALSPPFIWAYVREGVDGGDFPLSVPDLS
jgi:hypothetical protein